MNERRKTSFDVGKFLAEAGLAGKIAQVKADHVFFLQGAPADSIFYLQKARARLTVVSKSGKKATITLLGAGDFIGEESLAAAGGASPGNGHLHYRLHRTQDRAFRD